MKRSQPSRADSWLTPAVRELLETVVELKAAEDARRFFRDLCTVSELQALGARWQVARLLDTGVHYDEIARRTHASTATISRINTWLRYGEGGYRLMLDRQRRRKG
jgi:TrpR-related protein YerC/YecD